MEGRQLKPQGTIHSRFLSRLRSQLQAILQDDRVQGRYVDIHLNDTVSNVMLAKLLWNLLQSVEEIYADPTPAFDQFWKPLKLSKLRDTQFKAIANTSFYKELMQSVKILFEKADCSVFLIKSKNINEVDLIHSEPLLKFMGSNHQHLTLNGLIYLFDVFIDAANFIRANHQSMLMPILDGIEVMPIFKPAFGVFKNLLMNYLLKPEKIEEFLDEMNATIYDLMHVRDTLKSLRAEWDDNVANSEVSEEPRILASNFWHIFCPQIVEDVASWRSFYHLVVFSVSYTHRLDLLLSLVDELKADGDEAVFYAKRTLIFLEAELKDGSNNRRASIMLRVQRDLKALLVAAELVELESSPSSRGLAAGSRKH